MPSRPGVISGTIVPPMPRPVASPYRDRLPPGPEAHRDDHGLRRDALVVAALAGAVASIAHWSHAIEVFATRVLGFPPLP